MQELSETLPRAYEILQKGSAMERTDTVLSVNGNFQNVHNGDAGRESRAPTPVQSLSQVQTQAQAPTAKQQPAAVMNEASDYNQADQLSKLKLEALLHKHHSQPQFLSLQVNMRLKIILYI